jgi:hypothetical protein
VDAQLLLLVLASALGAFGGSLITAVGVIEFLKRNPIQIQLINRVEVRPNPVTVPLRVQATQPDPVHVEVQPVTTNQQELAMRVLAEAQNMGAEIGPRPLARVLGCSTSTASAYIKAFQDQKGEAKS